MVEGSVEFRFSFKHTAVQNSFLRTSGVCWNCDLDTCSDSKNCSAVGVAAFFMSCITSAFIRPKYGNYDTETPAVSHLVNSQFLFAFHKVLICTDIWIFILEAKRRNNTCLACLRLVSCLSSYELRQHLGTTSQWMLGTPSFSISLAWPPVESPNLLAAIWGKEKISKMIDFKLCESQRETRRASFSAETGDWFSLFVFGRLKIKIILETWSAMGQILHPCQIRLVLKCDLA